MFYLGSPHQGDSNEYTQYTIFNIKKENHPKFSQICSHEIVSMGLKNNVSMGLKNKFETAVVNESSVSEPPKY